MAQLCSVGHNWVTPRYQFRLQVFKDSMKYPFVAKRPNFHLKWQKCRDLWHLGRWKSVPYRQKLCRQKHSSAKIFVGQNFRHRAKISSLSADKVFADKVCDIICGCYTNVIWGFWKVSFLAHFGGVKIRWRLWKRNYPGWELSGNQSEVSAN